MTSDVRMTALCGMLRRAALLGAACLAASSRPAAAQSDSLRATVEITAVRYLLKQIGTAKGVTIDPAYARATDATGKPTAVRRSPARTDSVALAVNGTASSTGTAHGVHVILSSPVIRHDSASISVIGTYSVASSNPARRVESLALSLVLDHGAWVVAKATPLGK
ncbi:MAG TPA: hypothetical protein VMH39_08815 [Gemmatimonadaceae bacterium]|nr:hypothetical protein [Gemmatimonadaceae bacterium]